MTNPPHNNSQQSPSMPSLPPWLVETCKSILRWQKRLLSVLLVAFLGIVAGILINMSTSISDEIDKVLVVIIIKQLWFWLANNIIIFILIILCLILLECVVLLISRSQSSSGVTQPGRTPDHRPWIARHRKRALVLLVALILGLISGIMPFALIKGPSLDGWIYIKSIEGEDVGICNGRCAFDFNRLGGILKREAVEDFAKKGQRTCSDRYWDRSPDGRYWNWENNQNTLTGYWDWVANEDANDAEAKIYVEDQCVLNTHRAYRTIVVAVPLSGSLHDLNIGRDILQGVYIAQHEYNAAQYAANRPLIYLLIANIGHLEKAQQMVAQQVLNAVKADATIIGVTGLPFGSDVFIKTLNQGPEIHLPMVSVAPLRSNSIPNLVSVAPSFENEASVVAADIKRTPNIKHVSIIYAETDPYSEALKDAVQAALKLPKINTIPYQKNGQFSLYSASNRAASAGTDLVYFAGPFEDIPLLRKGLRLSSPDRPIQVFGGDTTYQWVHGVPEDSDYYVGLRFSAFAYPDEWKIQAIHPEPPLISDYTSAYTPSVTPTRNPYTYQRANSDVILAYDAMSILAKASLEKADPIIKPDIVWKSLQSFTPEKACQGVSGQISFAPGSSVPYEKAVLILSIEPKGHQSVHYSGKSIPGGQYKNQTANNGRVSTCFPILD